MKNVKLDILTSPGCKICHAFFEFWKDESKNWLNVELRDISVVTPEGQELVQKYMIFASPGIVINGELFQTGGFDKAKFLQKLKEFSE